MPPLPDIQRYCDQFAEAFEPQRIVLFGSYAYGKPTPDSDVDVIVRDPDFLCESLHQGDTFLEEITTKGRVMCEAATRAHPDRCQPSLNPLFLVHERHR